MLRFSLSNVITRAVTHSASWFTQCVRNTLAAVPRAQHQLVSPRGTVTSLNSSERHRLVLVMVFFCVVAAGLLSGCSSGGGENAAANTSTTGGAPPPPPPSGTSSATLTWMPPDSYTDGSALTIRGYRFYAGPSQDNLSLVEDVRQAGISSHMISGLSSGTWFFAVTAYDLQGIESSFSNIASTTF